jgi:hypothetical protein
MTLCHDELADRLRQVKDALVHVGYEIPRLAREVEVIGQELSGRHEGGRLELEPMGSKGFERPEPAGDSSTLRC